MSTQLALWDDAPAAVAEPAAPAAAPTSCASRIIQDGRALWYVGGLLEGAPRYEPRPDLEASYQHESVLPTDLLQRGWKRCSSKPVWLQQQLAPGAPIVVLTGDSLDTTIALAREHNRLQSESAARVAAALFAKAEKASKQKKAAA